MSFHQKCGGADDNCCSAREEADRSPTGSRSGSPPIDESDLYFSELEKENFYLRNQLQRLIKELQGQQQPINNKTEVFCDPSSASLFQSPAGKCVSGQQLVSRRLSQTTTTVAECLEENLREIERELEETAERHKQLRRQHQRSLLQLLRRDSNADMPSKVEELERKYELQASKHRDLTNELVRLRAHSSLTDINVAGLQKISTEIQTTPEEPQAHYSLPGADAVHGSPSRSPAGLLRHRTTIETSPKHSQRPQEHHRFSPLHKVKFLDNCKSGANNYADILAWANANAGRLFRAKYSYHPARDSPNENPEAELYLEPGDFVLVHGVDEDGFFDGELLNGARGLVPSNFVERVPDHEMYTSLPSTSKQRTTPSTGAAPLSPLFTPGPNISDNRPKTSASVHPATTSGFADSAATNFTSSSQLLEPMCPYPVVDVTSVSVHEVRQPEGARVPYPRDLLVERQLTKSVLLSWSPPDNTNVAISQFHVCVDNVVKAVIPGSYKTKALIEDVDFNKTHRVSVRAVTENGSSADASCTVTVGKDALVSPQEIKATHVTPVSAQISWYPSNSNYEHIVLLNGLKVGSCPSGIYQILLKGLIPSTMYRCSIRVKSPRAVLEEKLVESFADFKTLPKIGLPDAPANVNCDVGPQDGTLLITWNPVTNQPKPPSRAAVSGYLVYADGKKIKEVETPTGDHVLLRLSDFVDDPPIFITVRTRTREGAVSSDSNVVRVPRCLNPAAPFSPVFPRFPASTSTSHATSLPPAPSSCLAQSVSTPGGLLMIQPQSTSIPAPTANTPSSSFNPVQPGAPSQVTIANTMAPQYQGFVNYATTQQGLPMQTTPGGIRSATMAYPYVQTPGGITQPSGDQSYYVFHPRLSRAEQTESDKPSLLEMEASYLGKHLPAGATLRGSPGRLQGNTVTFGTVSFAGAPGTVMGEGRALPVINPQTGSPYRADQYPTQIGQLSTETRRRLEQYINQPQPVVVAPSVSALTDYDRQQLRQEQLAKRRDVMRTRSYSADEEMFELLPPENVYGPQQPGRRGLPQIQIIGASGSEGGSIIDFSEEEWENTYPSGKSVGRYGGRQRRASRAVSEPDLRAEATMLIPTDMGYGGHRSTKMVVALYDYSPRHMSPNPNAALEELSFRKGQVIKIIGEKDADGFYRGELSGRVGYVPCNLVSQISPVGRSGTLGNFAYQTGSLDSRYLSATAQTRHALRNANAYGAATDAAGYYRRRRGLESDVWPLNGSDPTLAQKAHQDRLIYESYGEAEPVRPPDHRYRRERLKQKSYSLDYDPEAEKADYSGAYGVEPAAYGVQRGTSYESTYDRSRSSHRAVDDRLGRPRDASLPSRTVTDSYDYANYPSTSGGGRKYEDGRYASDLHRHNGALSDRFIDYSGDSRRYRNKPDYHRTSSEYAYQSAPPARYSMEERLRRKMDRYAPEERTHSLDYYDIGAGPRPSEMVERSYASLERGTRIPRATVDDKQIDSQLPVAPGGGRTDEYGRRTTDDRYYQEPEGRRRAHYATDRQQDYYDDRRRTEGATLSEEERYRKESHRGTRGGEYDRSRTYYDTANMNGGRTERYQTGASARDQFGFEQRPGGGRDYRGRGGAAGDYYDEPEGPARGSFRKEGRDKLEQSIRNLIRDAPARRMIALYDYDPHESSPNVDSEMELNFRGGDVIIVYGHMDEDGFFVGEANGRRGLVPSNFLTPEPPGAITSLGPGGATVATTSESFDSPRSKKDGVMFSDNTVPGSDMATDSPTQAQKRKVESGGVAAGRGKQPDSTAKSPGSAGVAKPTANKVQSQGSTASKGSTGSSSGGSAPKPSAQAGAAKTGAGGATKPSGGAAGAAKSGGPVKKASDGGQPGAKGSPGAQRKSSAPAKAGGGVKPSADGKVANKVSK